MIVAVRAILIAFFELLRVFPKAFLAFLAGECHFEALVEKVIGGLVVTLCAVEPFAAARGADGDLGIENVFASIQSG